MTKTDETETEIADEELERQIEEYEQREAKQEKLNPKKGVIEREKFKREIQPDNNKPDLMF